MKQVILIAGASTGFEASTARALAHAGHTVYASMCETTGRNRPQVEAVECFGSSHFSLSLSSHKWKYVELIKEKADKCSQLLESRAMSVVKWLATFLPPGGPSERWCETSAKAKPGQSAAVTSWGRTSTKLRR